MYYIKIQQQANRAVSNYLFLHINYQILPTGEDLGDFHSSLEAELCTHVDYTTPKTQHKALAEKVTWLDTLPPVIMFQENVSAFLTTFAYI